MEAGAALVEAITDAGIDVAFTVPGESFLPALEAMRTNKDKIRVISVRQEGGGSLAAHGFGQLTGRPAAVFVSRGPGATNASIGLHAAYQDSIPLVMFVGHVRSHMIGREAFQEIDHRTTFESMSKAVFVPSTPDEMVAMAKEAIDLSMNKRPGPVVVVMPRDFGDAKVDPSANNKSQNLQLELSKETQYQCDQLADALKKSKTPLIIAGELARQNENRNALKEFAHKLGAPVLAAYRCQDVIDNHDKHYAGHLEINNVSYQEQLVKDADFIVVAGSRLDGITSREETIINDDAWAHIYNDEAVLERFDARFKLKASVSSALYCLTEKLNEPRQDNSAWRDQAHKSFNNFSAPGSYPVSGNVDMSLIADQARKLLPDNAIIITDGGSYARWIHRFFKFKAPLTQGGSASGAMGAAVPGSIGAFLATNDKRPVIAFCGDGGFMMTGQELSTAVRENIPVKIVVCDNNVHGSIIKGQLDKYGDANAFATVMGSPDFIKLAEGYGAAAWKVEDTETWSDALTQALEHDGPALIHIKFDPKDIAPYGNEKDAV